MEQSGTPAFALLLAVPIMTKERFAQLVGVEVGVVRGMMDREYLPTVKIGRHRLVNVAALQARCLVEDSDFEVRETAALYRQ
ncbi:MAG: hypothetical protein KY410_02650 [Proteobacteria bacterium]|nr:hypothetical protein [Pseudomonadota bacterium]